MRDVIGRELTSRHLYARDCAFLDLVPRIISRCFFDALELPFATARPVSCKQAGISNAALAASLGHF